MLRDKPNWLTNETISKLILVITISPHLWCDGFFTCWVLWSTKSTTTFPIVWPSNDRKKKVLNQWIDVFDCSSHVLKQNRITNIGWHLPVWPPCPVSSPSSCLRQWHPGKLQTLVLLHLSSVLWRPQGWAMSLQSSHGLFWGNNRK